MHTPFTAHFGGAFFRSSVLCLNVVAIHSMNYHITKTTNRTTNWRPVRVKAPVGYKSRWTSVMLKDYQFMSLVREAGGVDKAVALVRAEAAKFTGSRNVTKFVRNKLLKGIN